MKMVLCKKCANRMKPAHKADDKEYKDKCQVCGKKLICSSWDVKVNPVME